MARGGEQHIPRPEKWRLVGSSPWVDRDLSALTSFTKLTDVLARRVAGRTPELHIPTFVPEEIASSSRSSAVLIALHDTADGPSVVLTRRTKNLSSHKGEMSFPGGRVDDGESVLEAALREAREEVGLHPALVTYVGELDGLSTMVSRSRIHPIVGTVESMPQLVPNLAEVDRIVHVPLVELAHHETYRREQWNRNGNDVDIHFFEIEGDTVWGATGRMLHQLLDILTA
ncbi:MAG: CoA pyrophosphatase [Actinobacteria bacterium]|nr:CoA pyrophosphatase [Actinomycetota bacterium]